MSIVYVVFLIIIELFIGIYTGYRFKESIDLSDQQEICERGLVVMGFAAFTFFFFASIAIFLRKEIGLTGNIHSLLSIGITVVFCLVPFIPPLIYRLKQGRTSSGNLPRTS